MKLLPAGCVVSEFSLILGFLNQALPPTPVATFRTLRSLATLLLHRIYILLLSVLVSFTVAGTKTRQKHLMEGCILVHSFRGFSLSW